MDSNKEQIFAIKLISKAYVKKMNLNEYIITEIECMQKYNHPNIVKLADYLEDDDFYYIVMEYCDTNLKNYMVLECNEKIGFPEERAKQIFYQIVKGMLTVHENGVIHRDLKLENILIKNGVFKIADFGLSKEVPQDMTTHTIAGTQDY